MITSMTTLAATASGKIALSSLAAVTAFGGAWAAGLVPTASADAATEIVAGADASVDDTIRVDARAAGSFAFSVEDDELRLREISSETGWRGRLTADTDTALVVSFTNENAAEGEITAELRLMASTRSDGGVDGEIDTVVHITLTDEDGQRTIIRVDTQGSVIADGDFEAGLFADVAVETSDRDVEADIAADAIVRTDNANVDAAVAADTTVHADDGDLNARLDAAADTTIQADTPNANAGVAAAATVQADDGDVAADVFGGATVQADTPNVNAGVTADTTVRTDNADVNARLDAAAAVQDNAVEVDGDINATVETNDVDVDANADVTITTNDNGRDADVDLEVDLGVGLGL